MLEFGELWNEIIHCIHHHSQVSQQILLVQTLLYKVIWLKIAQICAKYFKIAILIRGFISTFAKYINLTENCKHLSKKICDSEFRKISHCASVEITQICSRAFFAKFPWKRVCIYFHRKLISRIFYWEQMSHIC